MLIARRKILRGSVSLCDIATLAASFAISYFIVGCFLGRGLESFASYQWVLGALLLIWLATLRAFGFYRSATYIKRPGLLSRLIQSQFIAGLGLLSTMYLTKSAGVSRILLQVFIIISFFALAAQKFALGAWLDRNRRRMPVDKRRKTLLIATPAAAERYLKLVGSHASALTDVVGLVTPSRMASAGETALPVLGILDDIQALIQRHVIDEVVIAVPLDSPALERVGRFCALRGLTIRLMVESPQPAFGVWTAQHFGDGVFLLSLAATPGNPVQVIGKRAIDVAGAAVGLVACGFAWLWYGARLRRETGDSALFRQRRVGYNGRKFTIYKFRTMHARAEQLRAGLAECNEMRGPIFKLSRDPRVTPTGQTLRRRHLDELPQFWNVLRGEMSLVGTRPPTEDEVAAYDEHHYRRLSIKPGLTGLWQVNGNGAVRDFEDVVKLDCEYIDNWSIWLDLKIMGRTMAKVMRGDAW
jgi:exopolysaccharide biosynthesis polyprenyl glycosylphosphotransferase